jgi:hypothetical protein
MDKSRGIQANSFGNLTSHTYNEELAEEIANDIPKYHRLMDSIIKKLS